MDIYIVVKNVVERKYDPNRACYTGLVRPLVVGIFLTEEEALASRKGNQEVYKVTPGTVLEVDESKGYKLSPIT